MTRFKAFRVTCVLASLVFNVAWMAMPVSCNAEETPKPPQSRDATPPSGPVSFSPKQDKAMLKEYGITTGKPIDSGFVFFDGKYIEAPYVVSRRGGEVYINEQLVCRTAGDDRPPLMAHPENATLPAGIDKNTSLYDERMGEYFRNRRAAVQAVHTPAEEAKIMEAEFRKLPFVKEARLDDKDPGILHITTYRGETSNECLAVPRRRMPRDTKSRYEQAEVWRQFLEKGLRDGVCDFLFSRGGLVTFANAKKDLPRIVRAVGSADPVDRKLANSKQRDFGGVGNVRSCRL